MNCLDFRRLCLTEPSAREPRIYLHLYHCPACRAYRRQVLAMEGEMRAAMSVEVPEGLDRKVMFNSEMKVHSESMSRPAKWRWAAAAIAVITAVVISFASITRQVDVVPDLAMHMADDPLHMTAPQPDARARLAQVMRHLGGQWEGRSPAITHATLCLIRKQAAAHLVVAGRQGPVTVFLMPNMKAREFSHLKVGGQKANVLRLDAGSIALFGYHEEDLEIISEQFTSSVFWTLFNGGEDKNTYLAGL